MRVVRQTYADGSASGLLKMHDDGSTRPLPEDDPSYLSWLAAGGVVEILPYVAPSLSSMQDAAVLRIREFCKAYIYAFYSPEKQQNIGDDVKLRETAPPSPLEALYTQDDFFKMMLFRLEARTICNMAEAEVRAAGTAEAVAAILAELEFLYGLEIPS